MHAKPEGRSNMQKTIKLARHVSGKIIHVDDAINGLACECSCQVCHERLQAVHPRVKQTHFRHNQNLECNGGPETALHLFAKQIILTNSEINVPGRKIIYTNPKNEVCMGSIIPDVTVEMAGVPVYFEIAVTHKTGIEKLAYYRTAQMKSIEIDLTRVSYDFNKLEIETMVLEKTGNKSIIFWEMPVEKKKEGTNKYEVILMIIVGMASALYIFPRIYNFLKTKFRS